jgi:hypothetical protein
MKKAKNILKISYGIDISSDDFAASYGVFYSDHGKRSNKHQEI